ncbi:ubiquitin-conjugating enzyme domain-containing protein [Ditylenchus destructor]|uniref:E2 ubiquitin-conjugating enzyme n=1 Tax=Ditylenchus destructor TaxID=166010 RepID=A0AAD4NI30_9BILA|nr:ubiquitin-conjugating enzyme domain-containing protein [Ditylenchus destructor]
MSNIGFVRMQKECKEIITSNELLENGVTIEPMNESLNVITGRIKGPPDSPYEDGCFTLDIKIPHEYPFKPPKVKFMTKIWHPNISSQTGAVCLDILKDQWAASMTLRTVLLSLQSLLALPEPMDPQDAVVAKQCLSDAALFQNTARFWSQHYAKSPGEKDLEMVKKYEKLMEMGVSADEAIAALSCHNWNLSKATESIFD